MSIPILLALALAGDATRAAPPPDLVLHEWGTFTSAQSSDGRVLDGLHHEEEALPDFVHQMDDARMIDLGIARKKGLARSVRGVTIKLETPVTYFHAPRAMQLHARVELRRGLLSQWYPWASVSERGSDALVSPQTRRLGRTWIDFSTVESGALEWELELLAPGVGADRVPRVEDGMPWLAARLPQANHLRVRTPAGPEGTPREEVEEFLFYRGLARFDLPLVARTRTDARVSLSNASASGDVLRHLFVLHVRDGRATFECAEELPPGASADFTVPLGPDACALEELLPKLARGVERALQASGLTRDEAQAMVETWSSSYFRTEGLRVLYVLPQRFTDEVLPLDVQPAPRECVRVLVGRLECLTPEVELEVEDALHQLVHGSESEREAAAQRISKHQRFLEPILRAIQPRISDPQTLAKLEEWLGGLD